MRENKKEGKAIVFKIVLTANQFGTANKKLGRRNIMILMNTTMLIMMIIVVVVVVLVFVMMSVMGDEIIC